MAIGIQNYNGQVIAPDSDYPSGDIKNNTGANDGTIVDRTSNADMQQFFAKLLRLSDTTPNGLPDNEYNGFQMVTAALDILGSHRRLLFKDGVASSDVVDANYNVAVIIKPTAATGHVVSLDAPTGGRIGRIAIYNYSAFSVNIVDTGANTINGGAPPYVLASGAAVEFELVSTDWELVKNYLLDL